MVNPYLEKKISSIISWSLVALFAGIAAYCIWYYYDQVTTAYDESIVYFNSNLRSLSATHSTTSTATVNWLKYTNNTYGFSIKYPQDYTLDERISSADQASGGPLLTVSFINKIDNRKVINIKIYKVIGQAVLRVPPGVDLPELKGADIVIGDQKGKKYSDLVYATTNGLNYFDFIGSNISINDNTLSRMISTFEFTK